MTDGQARRAGGAGLAGRSGLAGVMPLLVCPHCGGGLDAVVRTAVGCPDGHRFDIARQGYLSLLGKGFRTDTGDSADMVAARMTFLDAGHYRPVAVAVAERAVAGPVVEIGSGTGYYLTAVLDALADHAVGVALDSSKFAARRAAAAHPRIGSIVADAWSRLPVRDGSCSTVLSVFAPRDHAEIVRILSPGGRVVVVTPEPEHLAEIRGPLGLLTVDAGKSERLTDGFAGQLRPVDRVEIRRELALTRDDISALVRMGPSARHIRPDQLSASVDGLNATTTVTLAVTVTVLVR